MVLSSKIKPIKHLWHDNAPPFVSSIEIKAKEDVTILLRAQKGNVTTAFVEYSCDGVDFFACELKLSHTDKTGCFEYFKGVIPGQEKMFKYRFRVGNDNPENEVYYSRTYIGKNPPCFNEKSLDADDLWCIVPDFHTPDWAKGTIWYSIMPDAFYNGDLTNDEPFSGENYPNSWNNVQNTLQYKYGGDLKGIEKKLEYIKDLGCEAIFMDPIFKSTQNAGYGPEFYKQIENSFGNAKALADLAAAVHKNDMHYMIDIVLAFVAMNDIWFNGYNNNPHPGARQDNESPFHDYFYFEGDDLSKFRSSWGGALLNHANEDFCNRIYKDPDSYLQYYCSAPFDVDAIRYDCGGDLAGTYPDGSTIRDWQVVEKMRPILRKINPEIMMLSEYSMYYSVDKGVWDSRWNLEFARLATSFMKGEFSESELFSKINREMLNLPRNFALCQYTSISDHDRPRTHGVYPWAFAAYQLIQMTTVCAPCIYYGDEIKIEREHGTFYAMEWDESAWNYSVLNRTRALTSLRKSINAVRFGAHKPLFTDDDRHLLAFARKDESDTVITIASRNPHSVKVYIDTLDLEEPDGTLFTDWLTGRKYISANGKIDVELIPGGSVIVKGEASAAEKGSFDTAVIGEHAAEICVPNENALMLSGSGRLCDSDSFTFSYTHLFNECKISARVTPKGAGIMQLRASLAPDSPFAAVKYDGRYISVIIREASGKAPKRIACVKASGNEILELSRRLDGSISIASGNAADELIAENIRIDLPNHILGGFASLKGSCLFEGIVTSHGKNPIPFDDFSNNFCAMLDRPEGGDLKHLKSGLRVTADDKNALLLTNGYCEDWSFKTSLKALSPKEGDFSGIISAQDDETAIAAGRMLLNGKSVFFIGRYTDGLLAVHHTIPDTSPSRFATLQLQRIGTCYSAVVSYTGKKFKMIGSPVIANLCRERVGLICSAGSCAIFKYAAFGSFAEGGKSYNTPITPKGFKADFGKMNSICAQPRYRIVSGEWEYATEGYAQTEEFGQMGIENKLFSGFKADGTYLFDEQGHAIIEFAKESYNTPYGDGVSIKIESNGKISVLQNGHCLAAATSDKACDTGLRICAEYRCDTLIIYHGQCGRPLLTLHDVKIPEGYACYFASKGAHINNSLLASFDTPLYFAAEYEKPIFTSESASKRWHHTHGFINPFGIGVTDFEASATFKATFTSGAPEGYVGLHICSSEGKFYQGKGLSVVFNQYGNLMLKNGDSIIKNGNLNTSPTGELTLRVIKKNGEIKVFVNDNATPAIKAETDFGGGCISLCASKAISEFSKFEIKDITDK